MRVCRSCPDRPDASRELAANSSAASGLEKTLAEQAASATSHHLRRGKRPICYTFLTTLSGLITPGNAASAGNFCGLTF